MSEGTISPDKTSFLYICGVVTTILEVFHTFSLFFGGVEPVRETDAKSETSHSEIVF